MELKNHDLGNGETSPGVRYEKRALSNPETGDPIDGLHAVRITLDNPSQLNSYTTDMVV